MEIVENVQIPDKEVKFVARINDEDVGVCSVGSSSYAPTPYLGKIRAYKQDSGKTIYISWLGVYSNHRGNYIGTRLLYHAMRYFYERGFKYVVLLDASDRVKQNDSIYRQVGLSYSEGDADESDHMIGNIRHILFGKYRGMNGRNGGTNRFYREKEFNFQT